jgi:hypothetical protein
MTKLDVRQNPVSVDELLQLASGDAVVVVSRDGNEFLVEAADAFDREAAQLAGSEKFMSFLAERCKEPGSVPLEEIERRLGAEPQ